MVREDMRGEDQQQNHIFSYLSPEARVRKDHPLRAIRVMVDEVLTQLSRCLDGMYATVGRPSIAPEKLSNSVHRSEHVTGQFKQAGFLFLRLRCNLQRMLDRTFEPARLPFDSQCMELRVFSQRVRPKRRHRPRAKPARRHVEHFNFPWRDSKPGE